jgi:hypothetical protein
MMTKQERNEYNLESQIYSVGWIGPGEQQQATAENLLKVYRAK